MASSSYNCIKLEHFVPFEQEEFESGKLKLITRYKSDVKFSLKNSNVTKIKIPKNLVNLEPGCFSGCQHLQSIEVDAQNPNLRMEDTILVDIVNNRPIAILGGELPEGITRIDSGLITGNAESITIPASVTYIAPDAFIGFKGNITVDKDNETYWSYGNIIFLKADDSVWTFGYNVTWPSTLTSIPGSTFKNYIYYNNKKYIRPDIETAVIENGVTNIGYEAFEACENLTSVTMPNSVTTIDTSAFSACKNLTSIIIPNGVTSIGSSAFSSSGLTSIIIPNSVTSIGSSAFYNCNNLTSVTLSNNLTALNYYVFDGCRSLTSIVIPDSVTSIGYSTFRGCSSLKSITVGSGLTTIDNEPFRECTNVETVTISNENTAFYTGVNGIVRKSDNMVIISGLNFITPNDPNFTEVNYNILRYNPVKPNLTLSPSVKKISGGNSYNNYFLSRIKSITLNNTLEEIGDYAFYKYYTSSYTLENITIPNTVTKIGYYAFQNQDSLTSIIIPNSVTTISASAFSHCTNLTSVVLPNNITEINSYTFEYTKLTSIIIPNTVTKIYNGAFRNCENLISLNIPASVNSITSGFDSSFYGCKNLESITVDPNNTVYDSRNNCNAIIETATNKVILGCKNTVLPNTVTEIANYAFMNLDLTNVVIPNSVTKTGGSSFYNCTGGEIVGDITYLGSILLNVNDKSKSEYTIRENTTIINTGAFKNCSNLTSINIPNSITSIKSDVFSGDSKLKSVYISNLSNWCNIDFSDEYSHPFNTYDNRSDKGALYLNNEQIRNLIIPNDILEIKSYSFYNTAFDSIDLNNVTNIGQGAFDRVSVIDTLNIPNSVTDIGSGAFRDFDGVNRLSVTIGTGLKTIPSHCFNGSNLYSISIADSVENIDGQAFYNCSNLSSVIMSNNIKHIVSGAFNSCISLPVENYIQYAGTAAVGLTNTSQQTYTVKEGTIILCESLFSNRTSIRSITLPNTLKVIDDSCFYYCYNSSFTSITLPESLIRIGDNAFYYCRYLNNLTIPSNVTHISDNSFDICNNLAVITVYSESIISGAVYPFKRNSHTVYVPCSLYPASFNGVFRNKVTVQGNCESQYQWVDDKEICTSSELRMLQKEQISADGVKWYDTGNTRIDETVIDSCTSVLPYGLVVWLDGKTLKSGDTEWWCNNQEDYVSRSNWGVKFKNTDTSIGNNCMIVSGNTGGASIQTASGYDHFLVENPNPMYNNGIININTPITYELVFKLDKNYNMSNYMHLFGSTYTIDKEYSHYLRLYDTGYLALAYSKGDYGYTAVGSSNHTIKDGKYHVVTLTKNASNIWSMYIDGQFKSTGTDVLPLQQNPKDGLIGIGRYDGLGSTNTVSAPGEYYSFAMYNRALTAEEIQSNYTTYLNRYNLSNE